MGATRTRRALGAALLAVCSLTTACGDDESAVRQVPGGQAGRAEDPADATAAAPVVEPAAPGVTAEEIDAALGALESTDLATRREAVTVLLRDRLEFKEVTQLALRAVRLDGDVGLLADLLADHPDGALPHVLHRITHAAPIQRGRICRALGARRSDPSAAIGVLMVRALIDSERIVRSEARLSLASLSPGALRTLESHYWLFRRSEDGAILAVSPTLLLGAGNLGVDTPYRRALELALAADAARFGAQAESAATAYEAELAGTPPTLSPRREETPDWRREDLALSEHLAATFADRFDRLRGLLDRPRYLGPVTSAYALLGARASEEAVHVLAAWRRHLLANLDPDAAAETRRVRLSEVRGLRDVPWGARRGRGRPAHWHEMRTRGPSASSAYALLRLGNRSPEIQHGLWQLLALELHWYDRELVEVALQGLQPSGDLVATMLKAMHPDARGKIQDWVRGSARIVLPWSRPSAREAAWITLNDLAARGRLPRHQRFWIQTVLRKMQEHDQHGDERRRALIEKLRLYVFAP